MGEKAFEEWAILELMGHRRLAGRVIEETIGGASFIQIDVPKGATQFYAPAAVYCITPTTEDLARRFAEGNRPQPVSRYDLPPLEDRRPARAGSLRVGLDDGPELDLEEEHDDEP